MLQVQGKSCRMSRKDKSLFKSGHMWKNWELQVNYLTFYNLKQASCSKIYISNNFLPKHWLQGLSEVDARNLLNRIDPKVLNDQTSQIDAFSAINKKFLNMKILNMKTNCTSAHQSDSIVVTFFIAAIYNCTGTW